MTIQEYQIEAQRTCLCKDWDTNRQHMLLGIISEIGEIADAYKKELAYNKPFDFINLKEECADVTWYIANWATFNKEKLDAPTIDETFFDLDTESEIDFIFFFIHNEGIHLGRIQQTFNRWFTLCDKLGVKETDFYQGLENNIAKLRIRFPEKFTEELALNRNLDAERVELEK